MATIKDWTIDELRSALQKAISAQRPYAWYQDIKPFAAVVIFGDSGQTYEAKYTIAADGTITLGDETEVRSMVVYIPADEVKFSAADASGRVKWSGLIFRGGRFPERTIRELTEADIAAMVQNFPTCGIPVHVDHNEDSFLAEPLSKDGAKLTRVWQQGLELWGEIDVPGWFAAMARDLTKSVSVGLDNSLQALREISFVKYPRITDAAVFQTLPSYHVFATAHPELAASIRQSASQPTTPQRTTMKTLSEIFGWFRQLPADQRGDLTEADLETAFKTQTPTLAAPATPVPAEPTMAQLAEQERKLADLEAKFAAAQDGQKMASSALDFYEKQLRAGKVTPADRPRVIEEFETAVYGDQARNFSADKPESYQARLAKRYEDMRPVFNFGPQRIDGTHKPEDKEDLGVFASVFPTAQEAKN